MYLPEVRNYSKQKPCSSLKTMPLVSSQIIKTKKKISLIKKSETHIRLSCKINTNNIADTHIAICIY
jgi:hypothetical protein